MEQCVKSEASKICLKLASHGLFHDCLKSKGVQLKPPGMLIKGSDGCPVGRRMATWLRAIVAGFWAFMCQARGPLSLLTLSTKIQQVIWTEWSPDWGWALGLPDELWSLLPSLCPGHVLYADIKMENGKSKGCGVVKFESPEVAERACRMMNGMKLSGREIDVRIDRNA